MQKHIFYIEQRLNLLVPLGFFSTGSKEMNTVH